MGKTATAVVVCTAEIAQSYIAQARSSRRWSPSRSRKERRAGRGSADGSDTEGWVTGRLVGVEVAERRARRGPTAGIRPAPIGAGTGVDLRRFAGKRWCRT